MTRNITMAQSAGTRWFVSSVAWSIVHVVACLWAAMPMPAHAQKIYLCKDASGKTLTSDRPIPECADRAVRQLDANGMVRREIPPPLTAEQKREKQLEEERLKAERAAAAERKLHDQAILDRYRSEADIELARKRAVDIVQEQIKRESAMLASAEKRKKDAQAKAAQHKDQKSLPPLLAHELEDADHTAANSKKKLQGYEAEVGQINGKFDLTLKRFRELTGAVAAGKP